MRVVAEDLPLDSPLRRKMERLSRNGAPPRFIWAYNPHDPWHPWNELSLFEFVFWFFLAGLLAGLAVFIPIALLF